MINHITGALRVLRTINDISHIKYLISKGAYSKCNLKVADNVTGKVNFSPEGAPLELLQAFSFPLRIRFINTSVDF